MTKKNHRSRNVFFVIDDVLMMVTLTLNLALLLFEAVYDISAFQDWFHNIVPEVAYFYQVYIHTHFHLIDLGFVAFFLFEFFLSWAIAVYQRWYLKWYFYPFIHWYDLIGCVPIGSFRFLRILRVFSILIRLHKAGYINLKKTVLYQSFLKYYNIFLEEVSDRVVVNVLSGVQEEIKDGGHVMERIINEVLAPNQQVLVEWLSERVSYGVASTYSDKRQDIEKYVQEVIGTAFRKNNAVDLMSTIPVLGSKIADILEESIADIVFNAIDKGINDLGSDKNKLFIDESLQVAINTVSHHEDKQVMQELIIKTFVEVIEIMKDQVKVKKWKENF